MIYPRTKVLERRREVTSFLVRGISPGEIAEMLGVPRQTIYNDIRVIRSGKNEALIAHSRRDTFAQLYLTAQERARRLWPIVDGDGPDYVKIRALRELRLQDERIVNKLPPVRHPDDEDLPLPQFVKRFFERTEGTAASVKAKKNKAKDGKSYLPGIIPGDKSREGSSAPPSEPVESPRKMMEDIESKLEILEALQDAKEGKTGIGPQGG